MIWQREQSPSIDLRRPVKESGGLETAAVETAHMAVCVSRLACFSIQEAQLRAFPGAPVSESLTCLHSGGPVGVAAVRRTGT